MLVAVIGKMCVPSVSLCYSAADGFMWKRIQVFTEIGSGTDQTHEKRFVFGPFSGAPGAISPNFL